MYYCVNCGEKFDTESDKVQCPVCKSYLCTEVAQCPVCSDYAIEDDIEILYVPPKEHKGNDKELEKLKAENERLKKQLERYEKLIDML